jgi:hypothetical protein
MDIAAVALTHYTTTADGRMVEVPDDVTNVARDLAKIDPTLRLRYSETGNYFVVYQSTIRNGQPHDHLVLTAKDCDQRIVKRVREIADPSYSSRTLRARRSACKTGSSSHEPRRASRRGDVARHRQRLRRADQHAAQRRDAQNRSAPSALLVRG